LQKAKKTHSLPFLALLRKYFCVTYYLNIIFLQSLTSEIENGKRHNMTLTLCSVLIDNRELKQWSGTGLQTDIRRRTLRLQFTPNDGELREVVAFFQIMKYHHHIIKYPQRFLS